MKRVITLLTDFGSEEAYVGVMKGVILGINPQAIPVDLCHSIEPQNISQAAFVLSTAYRYFAQGTVHVIVVDPGVGSGRRAVVLKTPSFLFVAPDNGVLSYVLEEVAPEGLEAFSLTQPAYWLSPLSTTFHGRDIFAPVAAHLSLGLSPHRLGEPISSLVRFPIPRPRLEGGVLLGHIRHIDRFGNLITDFRGEDLPQGKVTIEVQGRRIEGLSRSYAEGGELLALIGSSGHLEIAARNRSAAQLLGVGLGHGVKLTSAPV